MHVQGLLVMGGVKLSRGGELSSGVELELVIGREDWKLLWYVG